MKKLLFAILLLITVLSESYNQENQKSNRFNISTGINLYTNWLDYFKIQPTSNLLFGYQINKFISSGIYFGYTYTNLKQWSEETGQPWDHPAIFYGIDIKYYFIEHFEKFISSGNNFYLTGFYGRYYDFIPDQMRDFYTVDLPDKSIPDYALHLGFNHLFSEHVGVYIEGGYGNNCVFKSGLSFTF